MNNDVRKETTEAEQIALLASYAANLKYVGDIPLAFLPSNTDVHDLEQYLYEPTRKRGTVICNDLEGFLYVVAKHKSIETQIYRTTHPKPRFFAVFNDHHDTPGWRDHRAIYECTTSPEWNVWASLDKKQMAQQDFAQFIEDNAPDIAEPPSAEMIEISRSLEAKKKVNFASGVRLSNGANELIYEETISGTASKGKLQVPEIFTIGIQVFEGGPRYAVRARLRYRISDTGRLTMWYDLERAHKIIEAALDELRKAIEEATGMKTINGCPVNG